MPHPTALFHMPSPALGACLMAGVERDTRGCSLSHQERFNVYPATPMVTISWIFEGALYLLSEAEPTPSTDLPVSLGPPLPRLVFSGPQRKPTVSWSPGPVHALTVGFYPEAMARLLGRTIGPWLDQTVPLTEVAPPALLAACQAVLAATERPFDRLEDQLRGLWASAAQASPAPYLGDWLRALTTRATHSTTGRSLRQWQRRIRDWTGQSQRDLQVFMRVEEACIRRFAAEEQPVGNLAQIAADAGYTDQSHMGRDIRRVTGMAPGQLMARLAHDEAFWYYRLIAGELGHKHPTAPTQIRSARSK